MSPAASARPVGAASRPWLALGGVSLVALLIVVLDQLSKAWIVQQIGPGAAVHNQPIWPGVLELNYGENRGAAFGLFPDAGWALALIATGVVVVILVLVPRLHARPGGAPWHMLLGLGLVLGGALGNLIDRVRYGYVVDFVTPRFAQITIGDTLYRFPTFNVADSSITVGVGLLLIGFMLLPDSAVPGAAPAPGERAMTDTERRPSYVPRGPQADHPVTPLGLIGALAVVGGIWAWAVMRALRQRRR